MDTVHQEKICIYHVTRLDLQRDITTRVMYLLNVMFIVCSLLPPFPASFSSRLPLVV